MKYQANPIVVDAFKIRTVVEGVENIFLYFENDEYPCFVPSEDMLSRIQPKAGDYLVEQQDGYLYLNPKDVFERKYSQIDTPPIKERKFEIGQTVFWFTAQGEIKSSNVTESWLSCTGEYVYKITSPFSSFYESDLFPSIEAVVLNRINYWNLVRQAHCEHSYTSVRIESDGNTGTQCCSKCGKDK